MGIPLHVKSMQNQKIFLILRGSVSTFCRHAVRPRRCCAGAGLRWSVRSRVGTGRRRLALAIPRNLLYDEQRSCRCGGIGRRPGLKMSHASHRSKPGKPCATRIFQNEKSPIFGIGLHFGLQIPKNIFEHPYPKHLCRCGGIGRRPGLKIPCPQGRAGSTPATGTIRKSRKP